MSKSREDLSNGYCNNWNSQIGSVKQLSGDCFSGRPKEEDNENKYEDYNYGNNDDDDDDDDVDDDEEEEEEEQEEEEEEEEEEEDLDDDDDDDDNADDDDDDQWC